MKSSSAGDSTETPPRSRATRIGLPAITATQVHGDAPEPDLVRADRIGEAERDTLAELCAVAEGFEGAARVHRETPRDEERVGRGRVREEDGLPRQVAEDPARAEPHPGEDRERPRPRLARPEDAPDAAARANAPSPTQRVWAAESDAAAALFAAIALSVAAKKSVPTVTRRQ